MAYGLAVFLAAIIAATQIYDSISHGFFNSFADFIFTALVMLPPFMAGLRLISTRLSKGKLLEAAFVERRNIGYMIGMVFIYLGHISVVCLLAIFFFLLLGNGPAYASGVVLIVPLILYFIGVLLVELSRALWKMRSLT